MGDSTGRLAPAEKKRHTRLFSEPLSDNEIGAVVFFPGCQGWGKHEQMAKPLSDLLKAFNIRMVPLCRFSIDYPERSSSLPDFPPVQSDTVLSLFFEAADTMEQAIQAWGIRKVLFVGLSEGADILMGALRCRRQCLIEKLQGRQRYARIHPTDSGTPMAQILCGGPFAYSVNWEKGTAPTSKYGGRIHESIPSYGPLASPAQVRVGRHDKRYRPSESGWGDRHNVADPWVQAWNRISTELNLPGGIDGIDFVQGSHSISGSHFFVNESVVRFAGKCFGLQLPSTDISYSDDHYEAEAKKEKEEREMAKLEEAESWERAESLKSTSLSNAKKRKAPPIVLDEGEVLYPRVDSVEAATAQANNVLWFAQANDLLSKISDHMRRKKNWYATVYLQTPRCFPGPGTSVEQKRGIACLQRHFAELLDRPLEDCCSITIEDGGDSAKQGGSVRFESAQDALVVGSRGEVPDFDDSRGGWRGFWVPSEEPHEKAAEPDVPQGLEPFADYHVVYLWVQMLQGENRVFETKKARKNREWAEWEK